MTKYRIVISRKDSIEPVIVDSYDKPFLDEIVKIILDSGKYAIQVYGVFEPRKEKNHD